MENEHSKLLYEEYDRLKKIMNSRYCEIYNIKQNLSTYIRTGYLGLYNDEIEYCYKKLYDHREIIKDIEKTIKVIKRVIKLTQKYYKIK